MACGASLNFDVLGYFSLVVMRLQVIYIIAPSMPVLWAQKNEKYAQNKAEHVKL